MNVLNVRKVNRSAALKLQTRMGDASPQSPPNPPLGLLKNVGLSAAQGGYWVKYEVLYSVGFEQPMFCDAQLAFGQIVVGNSPGWEISWKKHLSIMSR